MIPAGFVLLRTAFEKIVKAEAETHGKGPNIARQAAERLLHLLVAGGLHACRFGPNGTKDDFSGDHWTEHVETFYKEITSYNAFAGISVSEAELQSLLSAAGKDASAAARPDHRQAKYGRKPKANPYDIAWIVGSLVCAGDGLGSQADFYREIAERFEKELEDGPAPSEAPSETTLKPMIRRLFKEMKEHDKKSEH